MNAKQLVRQAVGTLVLAGIAALALSVGLSAQVQTQQTVQQGAATKAATTERGEVVWVSGNDVMVKMENGELRHFPNVAESARVTVGGRELSVHDLQPGMKIERTTVNITAQRNIKTVKTVNGIVWQVVPPTSVILTMENGKNQRFTIPKNQKFMVDGKETDAFSLRKGMKVSATAVTEEAETVHQQEITRTGQLPPPPPPVPANLPVIVEEATLAPAPVAAAEPTQVAQLPKTGSLIPLVGLLGLLSFAASFGIRKLRRS